MRCRLRRYLIEITLSLSHTTFSLRMILKISVARMKIIFNKKNGTCCSDSGGQIRILPKSLGKKVLKETSWFLFTGNKPSFIYKRLLIIRMLHQCFFFCSNPDGQNCGIENCEKDGSCVSLKKNWQKKNFNSYN
jgi:hypothetical protein